LVKLIREIRFLLNGEIEFTTELLANILHFYFFTFKKIILTIVEPKV